MAHARKAKSTTALRFYYPKIGQDCIPPWPLKPAPDSIQSFPEEGYPNGVILLPGPLAVSCSISVSALFFSFLFALPSRVIFSHFSSDFLSLGDLIDISYPCDVRILDACFHFFLPERTPSILVACRSCGFCLGIRSSWERTSTEDLPRQSPFWHPFGQGTELAFIESGTIV